VLCLTMAKHIQFTILPLCLLFFSSFCNSQPLRIAVPDYPPYTYLEQGQLAGEGYVALQAIMKKLPVELRIVPVPNFGRALIDMQNNLLDGLFLATQSSERNALAVYSEPLFIADWSWIWLKERTDLHPGTAAFKLRAQISAQMNSNVYRWLRQHGYNVTAGTTNVRGLLNLLNHKRVDAIMLPERTATALIAQTAQDINQYKIKHEVELTFGIYISKSYAAAWPEIIPALNQAIIEYQTEKNAVEKPISEATQTSMPARKPQLTLACCQ
jgi:ABC-type amino acid transport substrate-binding protein